MVAELIRVFVGIPLDEETRHRLAHVVRSRVGLMPGHPVPPENWHVTLRFLGPIEEVALDRVRAAFAGADLGAAFKIRWGALGAFPRPSRAGVLWIGMEEDGSHLHELAERVDAALEIAGFPPEDRPFRPHLTISRLRPEEDLREVVGEGWRCDVPMGVTRLSVFQSRLGRGGAKYRVLDEYPLKDR